MRYVAFISFRHVDPDQRWAKWLHTRLEGYRLPKALRPGRGSDRVGRIFRDAEELSACTDLPIELKAALADTEYLIVICSPAAAALEPPWVNEEIRAFAALGRIKNILAVLVRGEPHEAFPPAFRDLGIEPLAADFREAHRKGRKDALLRLLARLAGCNFDDLRQREQERRTRRAWLLAGVTSAAAVIFLVVAVIAWIQRDMARSRELAIDSTYVLQNDPELAVLLAMEGLRTWRTDEAEESLREGLSRDRFRYVLAPDGSGGLTRVAYSRDGSNLLTASERGVLRVWDVRAGRPVFQSQVDAHHSKIVSLASSPDGRLWVTAALNDPVARVWELGAGSLRLVGDLKGHALGVTHAEFSHDGLSVLTSSKDGTARVWNPRTGAVLHVLSGHRGGVNTAAFSTDDKSVFTAGNDDFVVKWDLATIHPIARFEHVGEVLALAVSPDGQRIATGTRGFAEVLDAGSLRLECELLGHDDDHEILGVKFSDDGQSVATAGTDGVSLVGDVTRAGSCPTARLLGHNGSINAVAFAAGGKQVITASDDHSARIWHTHSGELLEKLIGQGQSLNDLALSPTGHFAATASGDGSLRIWEIDPFRVSAARHVADGPSDGMLSHDGQWRAVAADSGLVRVWSVATKTLQGELRGHTAMINSLVFSADDRHVVTASDDGTARVWNLSGGSATVIYRGHGGPVKRAVFTADGRRVVSIGGPEYSDTLRPTAREFPAAVWDARSGKDVLRLLGHTDLIRDLALSPDGKLAATASYDTTAMVWDVETGTRIAVLQGHQQEVDRVAFSPDGRSIATTGGDCTLRVWVARSGRLIESFGEDQGCFADPQFSAEGSTLVARAIGRLRGFPDSDNVAVLPCELCVGPKKLLTLGHARVGRGLTPVERARYLK